MGGTSTPTPETLIDGRYRLVSQLGEGTFGEVWRAQDTRLSGRAVAVKFLKPEFLSNAEAVTRFESEADALAQVQHPNVVGVHDRGRWGDRHFLVTEFVEGRPLTAWIEDHRARNVYPDLATALALFEQVCAGVEAAHAVRAPGAIVHRDLKPDNVLVRVQSNGEPLVKILDFGIAQLGGRTGTRTGALMGTPLYMAPEQALGNTAGVGPWTDVFALGVILVEMLTLRAQVDLSEPWWGTALQRAGDVRSLLGSLRANVPPDLWDVIALALRSRGAERPRDAGELRAAVRGANPSMSPVRLSLAPTMLAQAPAASAQSAPWAVGSTASVSPPVPSTLPAGASMPVVTPTLLSRPPPAASTTAPLMRNAPPTHPSGTSRQVLIGALAGVLVLGLGGVAARVAFRSPPTGEVTASATAPVSVSTARQIIAPAQPPPLAPESPAPALPVRAPVLPAPEPELGWSPVLSDSTLRHFFRRWSQGVLVGRGAEPLADFYGDSVQFRGSGHHANAPGIERYFVSLAEHGGTFDVDWTRSGWREEALTSPDAATACLRMIDAEGPIFVVRAWATETSPDRDRNTAGDVACDRLEGRYLFRLRRVYGALRICHETWSLREGICASCPASRSCLRLNPQP